MSKEPLHPIPPEKEQAGWPAQALDVISGVGNWLARGMRVFLRWLKNAWDASDKFIKNKYHAYFSLTSISTLLAAINIAEVFMIERVSSSKQPLVWLLALPGAFLGFWLLLTLRFGHHYDKHFRTTKLPPINGEERKEYRAKFSARAGIVIGTLVPVIFCQFIFMPLYALPQFRKATWTLTYDNTQGLAAPLVVFSALWGDAPSPKLSFEVSCKLGETDLGCNPYFIPGRWDYGVLVNFTESIMLKPAAEMFITADITIEEPANLHTAGGVILLHYEFIDPIFSNDTSAAFNIKDDRYPYYLPYPWDSTDFFIANIDQVTVDDAMNTLGWSTFEDFPIYNLYNVISEPADSINENTTCFNTNSGPCTMSVKLQVTPSSNVVEKRQSGPGIDSVTILIDEGAIVGGMAFVAFFFGIYLI